MTADFISYKKACQIFDSNLDKSKLLELEASGATAPLKKFKSGALFKKGWEMKDLPSIGREFGFLPSFESPMSIAVFTTKGGVLKTTLTYNVARMAALHGLRTVVVGLDMQGDVTNTLGHEDHEGDGSELTEELMRKINETQGLYDVFMGNALVEETLYSTELPNLFYIPETPELASLAESIGQINRREYWLTEKIINPLKEKFDLVIMDCSPNWNKLTTNALVACDTLLSPLECKINNFRNVKVFKHFLGEFLDDMRLDFKTIFIPTKFSNQKKLSKEIAQWYLENVPGCTTGGIRESVVSEEAQAMRLSLIEHAPKSNAAIEMRSLLMEVFSQFEPKKSRVTPRMDMNKSTEFPKFN